MIDVFKFIGIVLLVCFILMGVGNALLKSELRDNCLSVIGSDAVCSCIADTVINKIPISKKIELMTEGGILLDVIRESDFSEQDLYECLASSELVRFFAELGK